MLPSFLIGGFQMDNITVLIIIGIGLYLLPWAIAKLRSHHNSGAIFALNLLLGWTLLGWVGALVWACMNPNAAQPTVIYMAQNTDGTIQPQPIVVPAIQPAKSMNGGIRWALGLLLLLFLIYAMLHGK
jgi:hypothetical protein